MAAVGTTSQLPQFGSEWQIKDFIRGRYPDDSFDWERQGVLSAVTRGLEYRFQMSEFGISTELDRILDEVRRAKNISHEAIRKIHPRLLTALKMYPQGKKPPH